MQFAVSNIAWPYADRERAYETLNANGVTGLEIAPSLLFFSSDNPFKPSVKELNRVKIELAEFGLSLVSMQSLHFRTPNARLFGNEEESSLFVTALNCAVRLAEQLGIPNIVMGSPKQRIRPEWMSHRTASGRAIEVMMPAADLAQAAGVRLAVECNPSAYGTNFLTQPEETLRFVKEFNHPSITINFDIGSTFLTNTFPHIEKLIDDAASAISHVHISEPFLEMAPADPIQTARVLRALKAIDYSRSISIEMRQSENFMTDLECAMKNLKKAQALAEDAA